MATSLTLNLAAVAVLASALVSGTFLSFSDFVMRSLHKTEREGGIEAMQIINREVFRTVFMVLLMGMTALSLILIGLALTQATGRQSVLIVSGGVIYFLGVFVVTMLGNVPLNVRLDKLQHSTVETATYWSKTFYPKWVFWNHVRTLASGLAAACFLFALTSPSLI